MLPRRPFLLLAACLIVLNCPAHAAWSPNPLEGLPVATGPQDQERPRCVSDGAGGALVLIEVSSIVTIPSLHVQRVRADGTLDPAWAPGGRLMTDSSVMPGSGRIVPDGAGGAIVAWTDDYIGDPDALYTMRVLANGALDPVWSSHALSPLSVSVATPYGPALVTDGNGGVIVSWCHDLGAPSHQYQLRSQHLLASGAPDPAWPAAGRVLLALAYDPFDVAAASDGAGGAFAVANDLRGWFQPNPEYSPVPFYGLLAQHVLANGALDTAWPSTGARLGSSYYSQALPSLSPDGSGGFFASYGNFRDSVQPQLGLQHVNASGSAVGGYAPGGWNSTSSHASLPDGSGGALLAWCPVGTNTLRAHRMRPDGSWDPAWPAAGLLLSSSTQDMAAPTLASNGNGGAIVTWQQPGSSGKDVFAQSVRSNGTIAPLWPAAGHPVSVAVGDQRVPSSVSDGTGGAIVAWQDMRSGSSADVYAQAVNLALVTLDAAPGEAPAVLEFARPQPSPATAATTLRFALPAPSHVRLAVFDANGRRVRTLLDGNLAAGAHAHTWDLRDERGGRVAPGLYFARLTASGHDVTRRVIVLD